MAHVKVLFEMVSKRKVDERASVRRKLHRGGQASLHDREIAGSEVTVKLIDVGSELEPLLRYRDERTRIDARPCDDNHAQRRELPFSFGEGRDDAFE